MAFVVEDGSGLADATSYLSVEDADAYFVDQGAPAAWTSSTADEKRAALILAAQYLDARFGRRWRGRRRTIGQKRDWPRVAVVDLDGYEVAFDSVPVGVREAAAEVALEARKGTVLFPTEKKAGEVKSLAISAGPLSKSTTYQGTQSSQPRFPKVEGLLVGLLASGTRLERG